jgi:hypothetical protein|tara:strand:+ start:2471 stop:2686 length:216 start_codon:yes stop_codon:yes gene_type:complete
MALTVERIAEDVDRTVAQVKALLPEELLSERTRKTTKGGKVGSKMLHVRDVAAYKEWRATNDLPNNLAHLA